MQSVESYCELHEIFTSSYPTIQCLNRKQTNKITIRIDKDSILVKKATYTIQITRMTAMVSIE
jgi:hypothetical protein